jgi:hypothetical protein
MEGSCVWIAVGGGQALLGVLVIWRLWKARRAGFARAAGHRRLPTLKDLVVAADGPGAVIAEGLEAAEGLLFVGGAAGGRGQGRGGQGQDQPYPSPRHYGFPHKPRWACRASCCRVRNRS